MSDDVAMMMEREAGLPDSVPAVLVGFTLHAEPVSDESEKQGRPVYQDREYVKIIIPGDKQTVVFQRAEDSHKKRFPRAYEHFQKREAEPITGTPISVRRRTRSAWRRPPSSLTASAPPSLTRRPALRRPSSIETW